MALTLNESPLRPQSGRAKDGEQERKGKCKAAKGHIIIWYRPTAQGGGRLTDARSGADAAERSAYAREQY